MATLTPPRAVVLLHGLGRSSRSMGPVERFLARNGYDVLNLDYPSTTRTIPELAHGVARNIADRHPEAPLHFVTHSLGGIIVRQAVAAGDLPANRVARVVMLGPPNTGSVLSDRLPGVPIVGRLFQRFTGPAGLQLGTGQSAFLANLPPVTFATGIIAGTRSYNPLFSALLGGPSDGKVRVDRARVGGMRDFTTVPYWHPLLMRPTEVHRLILRFLESGSFR